MIFSILILSIVSKAPKYWPILPKAIPSPSYSLQFVNVISVLSAFNERLSSPLYTVQLLNVMCDDRIVSAPSVFAEGNQQTYDKPVFFKGKEEAYAHS